MRRFPLPAFVLSALALTVLLVPALNARAAEPEWHHATSLIGKPALAKGFTHFPYVNPDAPKGGEVRLSDTGAFDSFNPILPKGSVAPGMGRLYETLMEPSLDELDISAMYGRIAEAIQYPDDFSWVKFRLNPRAQWHDGTPITPEDVVWSFHKQVELNPSIRFYYGHVKTAQVSGDDEVTFTFDQAGNRELPHIIGQLMVLPKHWWTGKDKDGNPRSIERTTLEVPLGSGPYRIKAFDAGRSITYERVKDYWGKDENFALGQDNFDTIRYESYRDTNVLLEAFKGDQYDWREENSAKAWATGYDFPAVKDGRVILEAFPDKARGIMQAFVPNLRRPKFADPRVREALDLAFDFESINRTIFYGQYKRIASYFAGSDLASSGLPKGKELDILKTVKDEVPPQVFTMPYTNPKGGDARAVRDNLRKALGLLKAAGWELKGRKLVNVKTGEPFTIEYLANDPNFERVVLPYAQNLKKIGIEMTIRVVDSSQYLNRVRAFDFDMITFSWPESLSPGNEQRYFWGSAAADNPASRNFAGIKDPAVDALIDKVIFAKDRATLVAAVKALDRVLLWNHFVIPQWYLNVDRTARWNRFSHPQKLPEYNDGFPEVWWWDKAKAAKTGAPG